MRVEPQKKTQRILLALWVFFVCKGVFYSVLLPVWEGYDEYAHFGFIEYFDANHRLPVPETPLPREVSRSLELVPLPWLLSKFPPPSVTHDVYWRLPNAERLQRQLELGAIPNSFQREAGGGYLYEGQQGPVYYWLMAPLHHALNNVALPERVFFFRWLNVMLASLIIPIGFVTARHVFSSQRLALGVVAFIAAMPELYIDVARVGNQVLAMVLYCVLTAFKYGEQALTALTAAFFLVEIYATQWILIPYYAGLISHGQGGTLRAFYLSHLKTVGVAELVTRLGINRPTLLSGNVLVILWVLYLIASAGIVFLAWYGCRIGHAMAPTERAGPRPQQSPQTESPEERVSRGF